MCTINKSAYTKKVWKLILIYIYIYIYICEYKSRYIYVKKVAVVTVYIYIYIYIKPKVISHKITFILMVTSKYQFISLI